MELNRRSRFLVLVCDCYCETHIIYIYSNIYIYTHGTRVSSDPMFHYQRVLENQPSSTQLPPCSVATTSMMFSKAVKKDMVSLWGYNVRYNLPILPDW